VRQRLDRRDAARQDVSAALAAAERIGAGLIARRARALLAAVDAPSAEAADGLTSREVEVLKLVAKGLNNQDIGGRLFVSPFTVKRHVANILTKLDLPSRAAAAAYAARRCLTN
jgi:DNA-binding NarL/FixJ family response regulator